MVLFFKTERVTLPPKMSDGRAEARQLRNMPAFRERTSQFRITRR